MAAKSNEYLLRILDVKSGGLQNSGLVSTLTRPPDTEK
ncbi:uncharacterized protein RAG0_07621 [Rhynchosporium agropyri]|uniref:Uncharacterized protein n=1 Tax=Rhynchosporium agropyri TaxID=914238 RepID=A0A1E1KQI4_9HELO|nr:uncharacterized protein RAG0_07621 [Rhynchosporium agropyri]